MKYDLSEITEVIENRRSISPEKYSNRVVQKEIVEKLLSNARWAPSHGLTQPWRFKVYSGDALPKLGEKLAALYKDFMHPDLFRQVKYEKILKRYNEISVAIILCMERDPSGRIPEIEEVEAVACAVQNMALTATAYGLGSFWSSPKYMYSEAMKGFLGLGEEDKCLGVFYLGYPEVEWPKSHRKPLEYVTDWIDELH